jgi:hypothetical protein
MSRRAGTILRMRTGAAIGMVAAVVVACGTTTPPPATSAPGPTPTPPALAAPNGAAVTGHAIDGITCDASAPQLVIHVHAHLAIFVSNATRDVPKNIGILASVNGSPCTYWLHSHDDDGIMHVESPVTRSFTLGDYFDVWGVPLDSTHVGPATGTVVVYLNGQPYAGDVRAIPLASHTLVQLDVNGNVPPASYSFPAGD